jgi:hypothetical protein
MLACRTIIRATRDPVRDRRYSTIATLRDQSSGDGVDGRGDRPGSEVEFDTAR